MYERYHFLAHPVCSLRCSVLWLTCDSVRIAASTIWNSLPLFVHWKSWTHSESFAKPICCSSLVGVQSIVISVSVCMSDCLLFVLLSVRSHISKSNTSKFHQIVYTCHHTTRDVAWSVSDGSAICYILPVCEWRHVSHNGANGPESKIMHMFRPAC